MSDYVGNRNNEKEPQVLLNKGDPGESYHQKHCRWMAHWSKSSSGAESQDGKSCNPLEYANNWTCMKNSGTSPFELIKSRVAERLLVGVNHEIASVEHAHWYSNLWDMTHDACQEPDQKKIERVDGHIQSSMMQMQKDVNLYAKTVVSKAFSIHRLSELSLDFQKLVYSDNLNSEWRNSPMFVVNQKIDSILNPKKRPSIGTMSSDLVVPKQILKLNKVTSNLMALSSQEYEHQTHRIVDEISEQCKPTGDTGTIPRLEGLTGPNSDPAGKTLKDHLPTTLSCSCSKDDNHSSSDCLMDENHTRNYFANPHCRSSEKFKFLENNDMFSVSRLGKEFDTEPHNHSKNSKQDDKNLHGSYTSHGRVVASRLLYDKHHHLDIHRMESATNVMDSYVLPTANTFVVNSKGNEVTHEKESMDKFADCSKRRGPYLFEMLTVPSKPQCVYPKDSPSSEKSTGLGVCMYGTNVGSHLFSAQNQPSAKTYSDMQHVSKSTAGIASSMAQKNNGCVKKANSEQLANLSMEGAANGFCNMNEHQDVYPKATVGSKQGCCMPGTENMDLDPMLLQISRMRDQLSDRAIQSRGRIEPGDRWLKRLQVDVVDPHAHGFKRSKIGETSGMFGIMINRVKENHVLDQGIKQQSIQEMSHVPARSVSSWLGRWCQGGLPVSHEGSDDRKQAAMLELASEELEAQFPSIAAMAMMGRAMSRVRPCDHKRKGPFVVWNTERD